MMNQNHAWDRYAPTDTPTDSVTELITPLTGVGATAPAELVPRGQVVRGEIIASTVENAPDMPRRDARVEVSQGGVIQFRDDTAGGREAVSEVTADSFYIDLNAIADAVKEAQENGGQPTDLSKRVFVGSEGDLLMGNEATGTERVAEVTGDTFFGESASLDAVAGAVRTAQASVGHYTDPGKRVHANRDRKLRQGSAAGGGERVSIVTADPFYAWSRLEQESEFVRSNMPRNTIRVSDGTYPGWHFTITNEFGDAYGLFLYHHPSFGVYRVALISPRMEGTVDAHGTHLWPDGTICLTRSSGSGYPTMGAAYAKAALWTRGASCYRRGYGFQFNVGQD